MPGTQNCSRRLCVLPACHAKGSCAAAPPCRRFCVLRLPRERQPRPQQRPRAPHLRHAGGSVYTAPATRKAAAAPARSSSRRLCVLRLPRERQPRPQRRPRAPQLVQEALWTAPATRKAAAAPGATTRAAARPGGSVNCACHAKAVCGPRSCDELCCDNMMKWGREKWRCDKWCEKWRCDKWGVRSGAVMSCAVISEVIDVDELCCDKWDVRSGAVMSCEGGAAEGRGGRRRRSGGIQAKNKRTG